MEHLQSYPLLLEFSLQTIVVISDGIYERNDSSRLKEGLPQYKGWWTGSSPDENDLIAEPPFSLPSTHVLRPKTDLNSNLDLRTVKTGFFFDQKYKLSSSSSACTGSLRWDCFTLARLA